MDYAQLIAGVRDSFTELVGWLRAQQPRLLGAAALLAVGWLLAILTRILASRLTQAVARMVPGGILRRGLPPPTIARQVSDLVGLIVCWGVLLFFVAAAADTLGLPVLSTSLAGIGYYLPRLLGALLILVLGLVVGNLAREGVAAAASAAGAPFAAAVGQTARAAIMTAAGLIAVAELGVDITLLTAIISVTLLAVLGAFAVAFGLGARTVMSNIIGAHYLRQTFEVGHRVRVGAIEGTISGITATAVLVRVPEGEVVIPANQFSETTATLVLTGGAR
jgi:small-conductance mechanosensitive channel